MFHLEHIFINIRIKLPLERSGKYKKRREGETHRPKLRKKKRHLWIFSCTFPFETTSEQNTCYSTERKRSETKPQRATFTAPLHIKSPPINAQNAITHNGTHFRCANRSLYIRNEIIYIYIWIYKKKTSSSDNDHLKINKKKTKTSDSLFLLYRKCNQSPATRTSDQSDWSLLYQWKPNVTIIEALHFYSYGCCFFFSHFLINGNKNRLSLLSLSKAY